MLGIGTSDETSRNVPEASVVEEVSSSSIRLVTTHVSLPYSRTVLTITLYNRERFLRHSLTLQDLGDGSPL
jgi:hypothetical protein